MASVVRLIPGRTVFFACDIQTRFSGLMRSAVAIISISLFPAMMQNPSFTASTMS
ncbi:hypothetical protein FKP32DRAFT_1592504 [Trametes sanguinea]|nr:hypothetical protein FKP32DRAFT_1592504 [Trametes sanguinea]